MSLNSADADQSLFDTLRNQLSTALLGDVLDTLGYTNQFLPSDLRPLRHDGKIAGRAMTVLESEYASTGLSSDSRGPLASRPFGLMLDALDGLKANEIYIASASSTGPSPQFALWGGLMSTRAHHLGCAGAILNGFVRDINEIATLQFPVWSTGIYSKDQSIRGKVIDFRCPIKVGDVTIHCGDLIFADVEGVLVVPREVEQESIALALEKWGKENAFAEAVKGGMSVRKAYITFGVM